MYQIQKRVEDPEILLKNMLDFKLSGLNFETLISSVIKVKELRNIFTCICQPNHQKEHFTIKLILH